MRWRLLGGLDRQGFSWRLLSVLTVLAVAGGLTYAVAGPWSGTGRKAAAPVAGEPGGPVPAGFASWRQVFSLQKAMNRKVEQIKAVGGRGRGNGYAGAVASPTDHRVLVYWRGGIPGNVRALAAGSKVPVEIRPARFSAAQVKAEASRLMPRIKTSPKAATVTSLSTPEEGTGLEVATTGDARGDAAVRDLLADAKVSVRIVHDGAIAQRLSGRGDDPSAAGAVMQPGPCSTAFTIYRNGQAQALTAAHCFPYQDKAEWGTFRYDTDANGYRNKQFGILDTGTLKLDSVNGEAPDGLDVAVMKPSRGSSFFKPYMWRGVNASGDKSKQSKAAVVDAVVPQKGNYVCTSGARSGEICNIQITSRPLEYRTNGMDKKAHWYGPGWKAKQQTSDKPAAGQGDSGGPVFLDNQTSPGGGPANSGQVTAVGIISAGSGTSVTCQGVVNNWRQCFNTVTFTGIDDALHALDGANPPGTTSIAMDSWWRPSKYFPAGSPSGTAASPTPTVHNELMGGDGLTADPSPATPGTPVRATRPGDGEADEWEFQDRGEGAWTIRSVTTPSSVLARSSDGQAVVANADANDKNQEWTLTDLGDGWAAVTNLGGGCLAEGDQGQPLTVTSCDSGNAKQRWQLVEETEDPPSPEPQLGGINLVRNAQTSDVLRASDTSGALVDAAADTADPRQRWAVEQKADGKLTFQAQNKMEFLSAGYNKLVDTSKTYDENYDQWWLSTAPDNTVMIHHSATDPGGQGCLAENDHAVEKQDCDDNNVYQRWRIENGTGRTVPMSAPKPAADDDTTDHWAADPGGDQSRCRPEGMAPTAGVNVPYCVAYDDSGHERLGGAHAKRTVGYFTGWRDGRDGSAPYPASSIPFGRLTHVNYAFAHVGADNKIGVNADAVPGIQQLNQLKSQSHARVKTLISVGGWAETGGVLNPDGSRSGSGGFYSMATNADGTVNQAGIDTFADSVVGFIRQYGFNGVDIDYEYATALHNTGNPSDWEIADARRKGLTAGYAALMKTLRAKLDGAAAADGTYYLLTAAASSSGYLLRGMENHPVTQYLDYVNLMTYDFHGSWNRYVGPNAPLYDDGKDVELANAKGGSLYDTPQYGGIGYFNTDWAFHYFRGSMPAGRIVLGTPFYTRGWTGVTGGTNGMWGTADLADQSQCPQGTGNNGGTVPCGNGASGVDNLWHDTNPFGGEVASGSNPMWHAKNLERGITPDYLANYGVDASTKVGGYTRNWDDATKTSWLWNADTKTFLSTEDEQGVSALADYVNAQGAGGAMVWELAGDYDCPADQAQQCGPGYTLINTLAGKLSGGYKTGQDDGSSVAGKIPAQKVKVSAQLTSYPTGEADLYPFQPALRVTNNTDQTLPGGMRLSFDIPTSTSPLVKDYNWGYLPGSVPTDGNPAEDKDAKVEPGRTGPNAGGLGANFHRVTITVGEHCGQLKPGQSVDLGLKYYLPITGPSNFTLSYGGQTYGLAFDGDPDTQKTADAPGTVTPAAGDQCSFPEWDKTQDHYNAGDTVAHNGHHWIAKWWAGPADEPGVIPTPPPGKQPSDMTPWKDLGPA